MKSLFNIKTVALIWLCALILTACSATVPTAKKASVDPIIEVEPEQPATQQNTNWQNSYGAAQERQK